MKFVRLGNRRGIPLALLGDNVKQNRFVLPLEKLKGLNQQRNIMPINRPIIAETQIFKDHAWQDEVFDALFDLMNQLLCESATNHFHELCSLFVQMTVGIIGHQFVQIVGDRADIFCYRPLVIVQDNNQSLGIVSYVVQRLVTGAAGKGGVACDDHDIFSSAPSIPGDSHT